MPVLPRWNRMGWPFFRSVATTPNGIFSFSSGKPPTALLTYACSASPLSTPDDLPNRGKAQSEMAASSMSNAIFCRAKPELPAAYRAPTTLPALVPVTMSAWMPCDSSALITPICAKPRAAPPPSARTILILRGVTTMGSGGVNACIGFGAVVSQPASAKAARASRVRRLGNIVAEENRARQWQQRRADCSASGAAGTEDSLKCLWWQGACAPHSATTRLLDWRLFFTCSRYVRTSICRQPRLGRPICTTVFQRSARRRPRLADRHPCHAGARAAFVECHPAGLHGQPGRHRLDRREYRLACGRSMGRGGSAAGHALAAHS